MVEERLVSAILSMRKMNRVILVFFRVTILIFHLCNDMATFNDSDNKFLWWQVTTLMRFMTCKQLNISRLGCLCRRRFALRFACLPIDIEHGKF